MPAPPLVEGEGDGFVFGVEALQGVIDAFRQGNLVMLSEDGDSEAAVSFMIAPQAVTACHIDFLLEHAKRLQVALMPDDYRRVSKSLRKIVLDNNNLALPALSVSLKGVSRSSLNSTAIAATIRALGSDNFGLGDEGQTADADTTAVTANGDTAGATDATADVADTTTAKADATADADATAEADATADVTASSTVAGTTAGANAFAFNAHEASAGGGKHSFRCPGAVPLACARKGGVLHRAGATEAVIELARISGLPPVGVHATLPASGLDALRDAAARWGLTYASTADLVAYQRRHTVTVEKCGPPARMPTKFGLFMAHCYRSKIDGVEHIALVKSDSEDLDTPFCKSRAALVRAHSECCTGDVFGSLRCDCGPQLEQALKSIDADGYGVLLYLRGQEGRGIGLGAKIHAYSLQERGLDTMDANTELGLPVDSREYGTGAQILTDLGIRDMRLISNNPKKFFGLTGFGLRIVERVPSHIAPNPENLAYLKTKEERMGHLLDLDPLLSAAAPLGSNGQPKAARPENGVSARSNGRREPSEANGAGWEANGVDSEEE